MPIKLSANELVRERHFLINKLEKKQTRNGDDYFVLELSDQDGKVEAKIWNNNIANCQIELGKVIEVNGKTQEYNGKLSLVIDSCNVVENEDKTSFSPKIPTMVFDIETVGKKFDELDEHEQDYLLNNLNKKEEDKETAKNTTGLYAIFGMVCAIACFDPNNNKGVVLIISEQELIPEKENYTYKLFSDEKSLLEDFWKMAKDFDLFVTYNGNGFDFPFLVLRSGINRVKVPFEFKKYGSDKFLDLQEKLSQGRAFKLEFLCRAFGIENPKEEGVNGSQVLDLFYNKEFQKIADYVARDAYSTSELYKLWKQYLSGEI